MLIAQHQKYVIAKKYACLVWQQSSNLFYNILKLNCRIVSKTLLHLRQALAESPEQNICGAVTAAGQQLLCVQQNLTEFASVCTHVDILESADINTEIPTIILALIY